MPFRKQSKKAFNALSATFCLESHYALRDMGIKHVPCVIQHVSRREELSLTGALDVQQHPDLYLVAPRPPLLKDYFDQQLRKLVAVPRKLRQIKLIFGIEMTDVPGM